MKYFIIIFGILFSIICIPLIIIKEAIQFSWYMSESFVLNHRIKLEDK
jgi:hypothetical protein